MLESATGLGRCPCVPWTCLCLTAESCVCLGAAGWGGAGESLLGLGTECQKGTKCQKGTTPRLAEVVLWSLFQGMFLSQHPPGDAVTALVRALIPDPNQHQQSRTQRCARNSWGGTGRGSQAGTAVGAIHHLVFCCQELPPPILLPWSCFPWNSLVPGEGSGLAGFAQPAALREDPGAGTLGSSQLGASLISHILAADPGNRLILSSGALWTLTSNFQCKDFVSFQQEKWLFTCENFSSGCCFFNKTWRNSCLFGGM